MRMQVPHAINQLVKDVARHLLAEPVRVLYEAVELAILRQLHHVVAHFCFPFNNAVKLLLSFRLTVLEGAFHSNELLLLRMPTATRMFR